MSLIWSFSYSGFPSLYYYNYYNLLSIVTTVNTIITHSQNIMETSSLRNLARGFKMADIEAQLTKSLAQTPLSGSLLPPCFQQFWSFQGKSQNYEKIILKTGKPNYEKYESMHWWDIEFIKKYYDLKITPRGLRATQTCKFLEEDLNLQWLIISTKCTL